MTEKKYKYQEMRRLLQILEEIEIVNFPNEKTNSFISTKRNKTHNHGRRTPQTIRNIYRYRKSNINISGCKSFSGYN